MSKPLSNKAKPRSRALFLVIFGLVALGFLVPLFIIPVFRIFQARGWNAVPCVIVSSSVGKDYNPGDGKTTYGVEIVYTYSIGNRQYKGTRFRFTDGYSSGREGKAEIVDSYPAGKNTVCYVNPANPKEAVLERGFTPGLWLGVILLVFFAWVPLHFFSSRRRLAQLPPAARWQPAALRSAADFRAVPLEPRELKPTITRQGKLGVVTVFAVVCIGFAVWAVSQFLHGWFAGRINFEPGFLSILLVPLSLLMIVMVVSQFLALFNPSVHLIITPGAATLGEALSVEWKVDGFVGKLARLRILLEGREESTHMGSGEGSHTDMAVFSSTELVNATERGTLASGVVRPVVPRGTMHSLDTGHNRITWVIRVEGQIPRWPGVTDEYPLVVLPARKGAQG